MDKKKLTITGKRQITIPQQFYSLLNFTKEAECYVENNALIIKPLNKKSSGEFAVEILKDLIAQNYSGDELIQKFEEINAAIRPAVETMIEESYMVAESASGNKTKEIFADVLEEE